MANDFLTLFVTDINRSFDGLILSIERDRPDLLQAALHARDLADALSSVGLLQLSAITADIARQLSQEQQSVLPVTYQLVELLKKALDVLAATDDVVIIPDQIDEIQKLANSMLDLSQLNEPLKNQFNLNPNSDVMPATSKSWQINAVDSQQPSPTKPSQVSSLYSGAILLAQRRHALNTVQRIRRLVFEQASPKDVDSLLGEHQDALLEFGQLNLANYLDGIAEQVDAAMILADADVLEALSTILSILPKASLLRVSKQALTLFIDLQNVSPSPLELENAGQLVANLSGRLEFVNQSVRLIIPSSLKRMRLISFMRGADQFVVSWAQLVSVGNVLNTVGTYDALGGAEGCPKEITLMCGLQSCTLYAEELLPVSNMNVFALPSLLTGPEWLRGVAIDHANRPYSWISLKRTA
ncbi:hypothetical protein ICN28_04575 [Polynucleobacter sp. 30F-ANTBAC]|uniref:hypothetical protein n=1 Tax=Polynucleobacter sp. 30F-ANTBAC TaxID=2689095 RepID=UPI001C0E3721|nr:hypothetical protein [Polynucleobacter sp. 30F-ANTBAC]MBU3599790.1 hypothetical protein [Polynucleobacter sp. 30F-ANTBAC]